MLAVIVSYLFVQVTPTHQIYSRIIRKVVYKQRVLRKSTPKEICKEPFVHFCPQF